MKKLICLIAWIIVFLFTINNSFSQTSSQTLFKVVWKDGTFISLLVSPTTTKAQLKDFIYKIKKGRMENTLSSFLPVNQMMWKGKVITVLVFTEPKWSTYEEYKKYERSGSNSNIAKTYVNHIVASYSYDIGDEKEYCSFGYWDGLIKSKNYKKIF